ncbi:hypothetical protein Vretimale_2994 [Volvox reticuliferus]|uniref:Uncharacterized protein n=1 Tax=Volvox reticuliferus TaxID=1737510 RepID=A0A8J4FLU4_9CHLO|nr:hypothetical protein Vretifemale_6883 [Volvox reticuliferus]GIL97274.1 hypothetical protein Vretimale_2994 [Volvox reticuliferus]
MRKKCGRRAGHVHDVRELASQHMGRRQDAPKDDAAFDTRSVLEQAASTTSSSLALTTLSRTGFTISPFHANVEDEDARHSLCQGCGGAQSANGLLFIPGKRASPPAVVTELAVGASSTTCPPESRPRLLNRLYLKQHTVGKVIGGADSILVSSFGGGPDSGTESSGCSSIPGATLSNRPDGCGIKSISGMSGGRGVGAGPSSARGSSIRADGSNSSASCSRCKRLAPVNLRVTASPVGPQKACGPIGAAAATAAGGMEAGTSLHTSSDGKADDDLGVFLNDEGEQSVTVATDPDLLDAAASAHHRETAPIIPAFVPMARTTISAAAITVEGTNIFNTNPAIQSCVIESGLRPLAANTVASSSAHSDGEVIAGAITDGLVRSIPLGNTGPLQAAAKSLSYRCSSTVEHHGAVGANPASLSAAQGGRGPKPPVTPVCGPPRKAAPTGQTSVAALSAPEAAALDGFVAAAQAAHCPAQTGACRIRMKLHSSNPGQLCPSMLAPLAKLLLPYSWVLHGLAVRPGCLELMLDYSRLNAGVEEVQQPPDLESDSILTNNHAAMTGITDLQVAELMSYLHQLGVCDPAIEPVISVQVNTQMRRAQWHGHGASTIADPHTALQLRGSSRDLPSCISSSAAHKGQMPSPGAAVAASAILPEQPVWQTNGGWLCQADPVRSSMAGERLNTTPDVQPVCLVVPCTAPADEAVLYVGVSRAGLHGCSVRCLGRFLPVRELQHLSAAAIATRSPASGAAGQPAIDWTIAAATLAAAGPDGEIFIVLVKSLPRHSGLLQVELRIGETSDWCSHISECDPAPLTNGVGDSDQDIPGVRPFEGSPVSPGASPLLLTTPLQTPPRPPWTAPDYGTREIVSAVAPLLLLRACTCTQARRCGCTSIGTGMIDSAANSWVTGEAADSVCTMLEASGVSTELAGLRAHILANSAATTVAARTAVPAADPALEVAGSELNGQDCAEALRQFISDLGLLLDGAACSELEMEDVCVTSHDYPSYSREVKGLLRQQLGLAVSGSTSSRGGGSGGGGACVDTTAVLFRQHMADTAATLLAGCMEMSLPYTARLVVSSATCRLQLCSEDVLRDAVAAGDGEIAARLDGLLRIIEGGSSSSSLQRASVGGDGYAHAVPMPTTMVGQETMGLPYPTLRGFNLSSDQYCDGDVAGSAAPAPADGLQTAEPPTLLAVISAVTTSADGSRFGCDSVGLPLRACLSAGALEQQHLNSSHHPYLSRGCLACPRTHAGASACLSPGPFSDSGHAALGRGFYRSGSVSTAPAGIDCSRLGCLEPPPATLRDLLPVLGPSNPSPFMSRLPGSQPVQPVRYQRFLTASNTADGTEMLATTSKVLQAGREELWQEVDEGVPDGSLAVGPAAILGSSPAPNTVSRPIQLPKLEAMRRPEEVSSAASSCIEELFQYQIGGADSCTGGERLMAPPTAAASVAVKPAQAQPAPALLREYGKQLLFCSTGFPSPHLEQAFWFETATRLQATCRLYASITIVFVSLSVVRALLEDGLAAAAFMSFYQGGQALLLAAFGLLGNGRPERLVMTVAACMVLRAVCHALLSRGLAPLPSFVLPVCRMWAEVCNEGATKAIFEQVGRGRLPRKRELQRGTLSYTGSKMPNALVREEKQRTTG